MLYKQLCLPVRSAELSPHCDATVIAVTSEVNDSRVSVLSFLHYHSHFWMIRLLLHH